MPPKPTMSPFQGMLNQKPAISAPQVKVPGMAVQKPSKVPEFAYMGGQNSALRHPLEDKGGQIAGGIWQLLKNHLGRKSG